MTIQSDRRHLLARGQTYKLTAKRSAQKQNEQKQMQTVAVDSAYRARYKLTEKMCVTVALACTILFYCTLPQMRQSPP